MTQSREGWDAFSDPRIPRRGWNAALAGEAREAPPAYDTLDAMAWLKGYDDALREREKDGTPAKTGKRQQDG